MRFRKKGKLSPQFIGPFKILKRVGDLAYHLALPPNLSSVHNVFHVSMLRKYIFDPTHILSYNPLEIREDLTYEEQLERILQCEEKVLQRKSIVFVKVLWKNHTLRKATWEREEEIRVKYPHLFDP